MIHAIATIQFRPEYTSNLIEIYRGFVPEVLKEEGCLEYVPTLDFPMDLANQRIEAGVMLVIERWASEEAFRAHLQQPHVIEFRKAIQGMVDGVKLRISQPVL
jgi:quinol monooxygenase YgiN